MRHIKTRIYGPCLPKSEIRNMLRNDAADACFTLRTAYRLGKSAHFISSTLITNLIKACLILSTLIWSNPAQSNLGGSPHSLCPRNPAGRSGYNALHLAAKDGRSAICQELLDCERFRAANASTTCEGTALHVAAQYGNIQARECQVR